MILDAWGWCTGMTQRDDMGREEGSGWGMRVYLWRIHVDIWQNRYNIVKLKNKINKIKYTRTIEPGTQEMLCPHLLNKEQ